VKFPTGSKVCEPRRLWRAADPAKFRDRQYSLDGRRRGLRESARPKRRLMGRQRSELKHLKTPGRQVLSGDYFM